MSTATLLDRIFDPLTEALTPRPRDTLPTGRTTTIRSADSTNSATRPTELRSRPPSVTIMKRRPRHRLHRYSAGQSTSRRAAQRQRLNGRRAPPTCARVRRPPLRISSHPQRSLPWAGFHIEHVRARPAWRRRRLRQSRTRMPHAAMPTKGRILRPSIHRPASSHCCSIHGAMRGRNTSLLTNF